METVFALILLFLLKIRYPRGQPATQIVLTKYGRETLKTYRVLENNHYKIRKLNLDIEFLSTCQAYDKTPKFLQFKVYSYDFRKTKKYRNWQTHLLVREITCQKRKLKTVRENYERNIVSFKNSISLLDYWLFMSKIAVHTRNVCKEVKNTHERKLKNLGILPLNWNEECVHNYSDRVLTSQERKLLSLGLDFCIPTYRPNNLKHYIGIEKLCNVVDECNRSGLLHGRSPIDNLTNSIKDLGSCNINLAKRTKVNSPVICEDDLEVLKNLGNDNSIIVTRPDKGKGVVILNRSAYLCKMKHIIDDKSKFKIIKCDIFTAILKLEDKLNRILRSIKENIGTTIYNSLFASGSVPGILYGLPKIHKDGVPLRPIISAINTSTYNLSKFLIKLITPFTTNEFSVNNSSLLVNQLQSLDLPNNFVMASFDVQSLFTNVPLLETTNIILDKYHPNDFYGLDRNTVNKLLTIATSESVFMFNKVLYNQTDGIAMGSPLGPVYANAFMCEKEVL